MARIEIPQGDGPEITRALSLVPHFAGAVQAYEQAVAQSRIDRRLHELVRMRIASINECVVCLSWRNPSWGASEEMLAAVPDYATSDLFTPAEKVALEYAERFCRDSARIPDTLLARLGAQLTPAEIVDLTLVIGKYLALGRFMQVLGLDQACNIAFDDTGELVVTTAPGAA
jgi:alkylhydroperoxidase family enzyme